MNRFILAGLAAAALLTACSQEKTTSTTTTASTGTSKELADLFARFWEKQSQLDPLSATAQGDNRFNDQLPNDQTQAFRDLQRTTYQDYLDQAKKLDREKLSDSEKISYDIFTYDLQQRLEGLKQNAWLLPSNQFWGLPLTFPQYGSGEGAQPFKTVQDYDNWLGRVRAYPAWTDSAISNFRRGMAAGVVLPRALVVKMLPQLRGALVKDTAMISGRRPLVVSMPDSSVFMGAIQRLPKSFSQADQARLTTAYRQAIMQELVPAYTRLATFLQKEYLPKARATSGIGSLPGGPENYKYLVSYWTTTDQTPAQIYQTGLREVARIRGEMEQVKTQVGFRGDLGAFFAALRKDPKLMPFKTPEEVLDFFHNTQKKIDPNLKKMFGRVPKTPFEIRRTEAFREASASAEYMQGSADGSRPGIFYVPIPDATKFNVTTGMESLFLHEAIPGHHYQISLQQENTSLPKFQRFAGYGAYVEGWALYCESLGPELGLYTDPYQRMGALNDEMLRAVRLVVDTGLHSRNMTREQAIDYMLNNLPLDKPDATSAIERYMAIPGQALSYKIGALKIRELRAKYEKQLGSKFSLSNFHDELLKDGAMPLAVLERKMDAWAAKQ